MAAFKMSGVWSFNFAAAKQTRSVKSLGLPAFVHRNFPGLNWHLSFYARGNTGAKPNKASIYVRAVFGTGKEAIKTVWAEWTLSVKAESAENDLQVSDSLKQFVPSFSRDGLLYGSRGYVDAFEQDAVEKAVRTSGLLMIQLDLTVYRIDAILRARDTLGALRADDSSMDFAFKIGSVSYKCHKAILARKSTKLAAIVLDSDELPLTDVTPPGIRAFIGALYGDFEFLSQWKTALDVLKLAHRFSVDDLTQFCDSAMAELVPNSWMELSSIFHILPVAIEFNAAATRAACFERLDENKGWIHTEDWSVLKAEATDHAFGICEVMLQRPSDPAIAPRLNDCALNVPELNLFYTLTFDAASLARACTVKPLSPLRSFPGLEWAVEFYPQGNAQDPTYTPGHASVYAKVTFGQKAEELKSVYAKWTVSIAASADVSFSAPSGVAEYVVYSGEKEMRFGYANAFRVEDLKACLDKDGGISLQFDLTEAKIPLSLKSRDLLGQLYADTAYTDVDVDINGSICQAHKCVLAASSFVFSRMFEVDMTEHQTSKVEIPDTTPAAFENFKAAVYYHSWDFLSDMDATLDVLQLADKYAVLELKAYCDEALARFVSDANVLDVLRAAATYDAEKTKAACVNILFSSEEKTRSPQWILFKKTNKEIMGDIVESLAERYRAALKRKHEDDD